MSALVLGLRRGASVASTDAWWIASDEPAVWLEAIGELGFAAGAVRAFPLPATRRDARAAGLLLTAPGGAAGAGRSPRARPMRRIAGRLLVPAEAELVPPADEHELAALLGERTGVLLPDGLFVAFTDADALGLVDLVAPPPRGPARWDGALPGLALAPRLIAVDVERAPLEEALRAGGESIASRPVTELPPAPGETRRPGRWRAKLRQALSSFVLAWTKRAKRTASKPTWIDALERLARRLVSQDVLDERARQLARLLALLDSDPEQGLQYALPVKTPAGRGLAPPGAKLERRTADYDPARLGAAGLIDTWKVDPRTRRELIERYRRLANRELELGRARRAAYVFAELLGDLRAAAQALATGRFYLEAAELYRDRLGDRLAAARCFERGGLLVEALAEWRALNQLERVAELLGRLGRDEEARAVHRERVQRRLAAHDRLGAASILERDLELAEEALELLAAAWPDDPNLESCLRSYFGLLARTGKHAQAVRFVSERAATLPAPPVREAWLRVLAHLAASSGQADLCADAADAARVLVGRALQDSRVDGRSLVSVLAQSDPGDALLRRDTVRYTQALQAELRAGQPLPQKPRLASAGDFRVDVGDPKVCSLAATRELLLVLTNDREDQRPRLDAYAWQSGRCVATWRWKDEPPLLRRALILVVAGETGQRILAVPEASERRFELVERVVAGAGRLEVGTPEWMPPRIRALCTGARGELWIAHERGKELLVSRHDPAGALLRQSLIAMSERDLDPERLLWGVDLSSAVSLAAAGDAVFVSADKALARVDGSGDVEGMYAAGSTLLAKPARDELVVVCGERCFLWPPRPGRGQSELCAATVFAAFLRGGLFVGVHARGITVASVEVAGARTLVEDPRPHRGELVGLVAAAGANEFALVSDDGLVQRILVNAGE